MLAAAVGIYLPLELTVPIFLGGLLSYIVERMARMITELKQHGVAILVSEQNLYFAEAVSDRAYVIEKGHIRFSGTMKELAGNEEIRRSYLTV